MNARFLYGLLLGILSLIAFNIPSSAPAQTLVLCNGQACAPDGNSIDITTLPAQLAATPQYVNNGSFIAQNDLRANFPCGPLPMLGKYARVLDTYQTVSSIAICETDGNTFYWRPIRTDYATTTTQSSGTINLIPFITSPVLIVSSSPTGTLTITPSTTNAWPGAQFHIYMPSTITLPYAITVSGLIGNGTLTAVQGRDYLLTYTALGWKSN